MKYAKVLNTLERELSYSEDMLEYHKSEKNTEEQHKWDETVSEYKEVIAIVKSKQEKDD